MTDIQSEIQGLRGMERAELIERYTEVFGRSPRIRSREFLWKRIAWKIQEQRYGGLSTIAKARLEELIQGLDLPLDENVRKVTGQLRGKRKPGDPMPGTVLIREWHEQQIRVEVLDGGYEWDGAVYRSLTAVAKAVTGSKWNGRLFFGLSERAR
jgi:Protein of unknown function (DUF2924)